MNGTVHRSRRSGRALGEKLVFLVEDNPDDEALALRALKKSGVRCSVEVARDGQRAIEYLGDLAPGAVHDSTPLPDLILLDMKLPKLGAPDVLRFVRSHAHTRLIPVVVLTNSREEQDITQAYLAGANSYVCKPVDYEQFVDVLRQLSSYWMTLNENLPTH